MTLDQSHIAALIRINLSEVERQIDVDMIADQIGAIIASKHDQRVTELLQHNNELLERARSAERESTVLRAALRASLVAAGKMAEIDG